MQNFKTILIVGFLAVLSAIPSLSAGTTLAPIFSDGLVLQREKKVPVWGLADDGTEVIVDFAGQTKSAVAQNGKWVVELDEMTVSNVGRELMVSFKVNGVVQEIVTVKDVLIGDVWLCAGQSNMRGKVGDNPVEELTDLPLVRHFSNGDASWAPAVGTAVAEFTATGYYFGAELHRQLNIPIGLVRAAQSGTPIENWISKDAINSVPKFKTRLDLFMDREWKVDFLAAMDEYNLYKDTGYQPADEYSVVAFLKSAGSQYRSWVLPHIPFIYKGITWYQGEANAKFAKNAEEYSEYLSLLASSWRDELGNPDMPFYYVQLPSITRQKTEDFDRWYEIIRQEQLDALTLIPNSGMAVNIDINDGLHPRFKNIMGRRLASLALRDTYQIRTECASGPLFEKATINGSEIICSFSEVGSGLICTAGSSLNNFEIAGSDGQFVNADAYIANNKVIVSAAGIDVPVYVRYAYHANPVDINFFNVEGFPASPFTTLPGPRVPPPAVGNPPDTDPNPDAPDTTVPTTPQNLSATAISSSQITLSWAASIDPVVTGQIKSGMAGYEIRRDGQKIGTSTTASYSDTGLSLDTTYAYTVAAFDTAGNFSALSTSASATTPGSTVNLPTVSLRATDTLASEPNALINKGTAKFKIERTGETNTELVVNYSLSGTAVNGTDYALLTGSVTIPIGKTYVTVAVKALSDTLDENDETVIMTLSGNSGYTVDQDSKTGTVTLLDAEYDSAMVSVKALDDTASEPAAVDAQGTAKFIVTRTGSLGLPLEVKYTLNGTAFNGDDYASCSGTLTILVGKSTAVLKIRALDDTLTEGTETVQITLSADSGYQLDTAQQSATVSIIDAAPAN